ncbi:MAG: alcohol dehydrogenase catalytic domain-containing protein [Spirochaetales bacterium]|jgi:threonine dehydrogenase-like Zn-dependent dehydrogenase|nr:alcohol dehydrogenase catalytic domain-containing protein [Spirochaetales bacterium]
MKSIVASALNTVAIGESPVPVPGKGQVRIKTAYCGICTTDVVMLRGSSRLSYPFVLGHEWSGYVDAVGSGGKHTLVGKPCVAENVLSSGGEVGFEHPGGYSEFFLTDEQNIRLLPRDADMASAILVEPLAVCIRGIHRLNPDISGPVLVLGDGPIGLLMTSVMRRHGCRDITVVGGRPRRLGIAERLGASSIVNYHECIADELAQHIATVSNDRYTSIVEATGMGASIRLFWHLADHRSRILLLGDYEHVDETLPWQHILHQEISLISSNASAGAWDEAVDVYAEIQPQISPLVSHQFEASELSQVSEGLRMTEAGERNLIKAALNWYSMTVT